MPFLTEIKERLSATQDTKKITQSLQLVAANKMKGFVKKALSARAYAWELLEVLESLPAEDEREMFPAVKNQDAPELYILVSSDKGLCGTLNQRLIKHMFNPARFKSSYPLLVTIGRKAAEAARRKGVKPILSFESIGEDLDSLKALEIIEPVFKLWQDGECSRVVLVSPHYESPFVSRVVEKTYLPLSAEMAKTHLELKNGRAKKPAEQVLMEPSAEKVADILFRQLVESIFLQAFFELKASEYSSRMVAMKKATDAAGEVIEALQLDYNKARQGIITQQLSELAGASEAMLEEELVAV